MLRTRSHILFPVFTLLLLFPGSGADAQDAMPGASVTVRNYDWKGDLISQGAGFFINAAGELITATSLLEGGSLTEVRGGDGSLHSVACVVAVDAYGGLSRVKLETVPESFTPLSVSAGMPARGATVLVVRPDQPAKACRVREVRVFPDIDEFALLAFSEPGAGPPGTPIIDLAGRVAGVTVWSMEGEPAWTLVTHPTSVRLLADAPQGGVAFQEWVQSGEGTWASSYIGAVLRGVAYASLGDSGRAGPALEEAIRYGIGTHAEVYVCLGNLEAAAGRYEEAQAHFSRALALDPTRLEIYERLAYVQVSRGLGDQAEATARTAAAAFSDGSSGRVLLSRVLNARGRFEDALQVAMSAAQAAPEEAGPWSQAAAACIGMGLFEEAVIHGMRATDRDRNDAEAYSNLGYACLRSGQPLRAILALRRAAELAPDEGEFLKTLGEAYSCSGLASRAIAAYRLAICIDPSDWQAYWRLADACLTARDYEEAAVVCRQAVSRCPDNGWLRFKLGKAYFNGGDRESAVGQIRMLQEINVDLARQLRVLLEESEIAAEGWNVF